MHQQFESNNEWKRYAIMRICCENIRGWLLNVNLGWTSRPSENVQLFLTNCIFCIRRQIVFPAGVAINSCARHQPCNGSASHSIKARYNDYCCYFLGQILELFFPHIRSSAVCKWCILVDPRHRNERKKHSGHSSRFGREPTQLLIESLWRY